MKKIVIGLLCCLLVLGGIGACEYGYIHTLKENGFQETEQFLCVGETRQEQLKKNLKKCTWSVADENVASVTQNGILTGVSAGTTTVTVKNGIFKYQCQLVVREHLFTEATCEEDSYCVLCGALGAEKALEHDVTELTCTEDSVCRRCGRIVEKATGHQFSEATCEEGSVCVKCGMAGEEGPLGHDFTEATCELPEICTRCGETGGESLGHIESEIVCLQPVVCERCGKVLAEAAEHDFKPATCTKPETCSRCKATRGEALGHDADPATCTSDSVCKRCRKVIQKKVPHEYVDTANGRICAYCGQPEPKAPTTTTTPTTGDSFSAQSFIDQVVALVNEQRAANGLSALTADATLMKVAQLRSDECTTTYSHIRPNGTQCFTAFEEYGAQYSTAGENIAAGYKTPEAVMNGWMNSEGHRANILNPGFNKIGVGVSQCATGSYHIFWAQVFTD